MPDNGGATAQRGFNYQRAVIALVAIRNINKKNFEIYVETDDDFEVVYDNYHAYLQVKGIKNASLKKLLQDETSIIEKNLSNGDSNSNYKIVLYNFHSKELTKMSEIESDELFGKAYLLSDEQKSQVINGTSDDIADDGCDRLAIVITDFKNDARAQKRYLLGEMSNQNIAVDDRGNAVLDELASLISQKSEKNIQLESDRLLKRISIEELSPLLEKMEAIHHFDQVLENLGLNTWFKNQIRAEKNKISTFYSEKRKKVSEAIKTKLTPKTTDIEIITTVLESDCIQRFNEQQKYAICISAYCDVIKGFS